jgi:predicted branched-subunit amino acid permease
MWCDCGYDFTTGQLRPQARKQKSKIAQFVVWLSWIVVTLFGLAFGKSYPVPVLVAVVLFVIVLWLIPKKKT